MQQMHEGAIDLSVRYRRAHDVATSALTPSTRGRVEIGLLFITVCLFWGFVLFEALAVALR